MGLFFLSLLGVVMATETINDWRDHGFLRPLDLASGFSRPESMTRSRKRNSICPFTLRKSSLAHRRTASMMLGSMRSRNESRDATAACLG